MAHLIFLLDSASLINWFLQRLSSPTGPAGRWLLHSPVTNGMHSPWHIADVLVNACCLNESNWCALDQAGMVVWCCSSTLSHLSLVSQLQISILHPGGWRDILSSSSKPILETCPPLLSPRSFLWELQTPSPTSCKTTPWSCVVPSYSILHPWSLSFSLPFPMVIAWNSSSIYR